MNRGVLAAAVALACGMGVFAGQPPARGVFTAEQAAAGRAAYQANCSSCHLPDLAGRNEAPQLAGTNFMNTWRARSTRDLFEYIQSTMPPTGGNIGEAQYLAVTAYILQANGAQPGAQALTPATAVSIGSVATGPVATTTAQGVRPASDTAGQPTAGRGQAAAGAAASGRGAAAAATGPLGLTVSGSVRNYVPVTDEMLRNQDPADWLMARRNYQAWSHTPLTQIKSLCWSSQAQ